VRARTARIVKAKTARIVKVKIVKAKAQVKIVKAKAQVKIVKVKVQARVKTVKKAEVNVKERNPKITTPAKTKKRRNATMLPNVNG